MAYTCSGLLFEAILYITVR